MNDKRILLLGAGGAARGVILPILNQHPAQLVIANRTVSKATDLARQFGEYGVVDASGFESLQQPFDIIINATSASLSADLPPIPAMVFGSDAFAYDMMYGKEPTVFMRFALQHGATVRDGLGMLVEQAAESFFMWRGMRPDTAPVFSMLRAKL
jgi:shikimate dehydrogenase